MPKLTPEQLAEALAGAAQMEHLNEQDKAAHDAFEAMPTSAKLAILMRGVQESLSEIVGMHHVIVLVATPPEHPGAPSRTRMLTSLPAEGGFEFMEEFLAHWKDKEGAVSGTMTVDGGEVTAKLDEGTEDPDGDLVPVKH